MKRSPSQWLIGTYTAINHAAAFALRDQLANASQCENSDTATTLSRHDQDPEPTHKDNP